MARILLGVTGGIAAYKALELTRLAMKAGHAVRVIQTEASTRFVGTASFAGITGAPVLVTEWERDPLRGAFPGDPRPEHEPLSHLELVQRADVFLIAPGLGQHDRQAGRRPRRQPADHRRARLPAPADRRAGDERRDVGARRDAGERRAPARARGDACSSPAPARSRSIGEYGAGRLPEPPELLAAVEAALGSRRDLDGLEVLVTAGGTREPIDAVRFVGNRSSGRMGFALAEEAARRGAGVTVVAANVSLPALGGHRLRRRPDRRRARRGLRGALRPRRHPADGRRRRRLPAGAAHEGKIKKDEAGEELALDLERTTDVLSELSARRRDGQTAGRLRRRARRGGGRVRPRQAGAQGPRRRRRQRHRARRASASTTPDNEVTIVTADGEVHVPAGLQGRGRARHPGHGLEPAFISDMKVPR